MEELITYISSKALAYWNDTADDDSKITTFPSSIVDFVVEYATSCCHFPSSFTEEKIVSELTKCKTSLAMACVDVYAKAGSEGEKSHSENGVSRTYENSWISQNLLDSLPNFVDFIN